MIYITGDCHGDFRRFSRDNFPEQREMTREDFVIVCGDFGIWQDTKDERYWLDWLQEKPFTLLFVDGNHENFDRLEGGEFETVAFHGGKAHRIRENVYHLMRGHVFELGGKKIFAFGGAASHDVEDGILDERDFASHEAFARVVRSWRRARRMFRINHVSWWSRELPSEEEMAFGRSTLAEHGNQVDFIVSHCCPQQVAAVFSQGMYRPDVLTGYFNDIAETVQFDRWFFGHYHDNRMIMGKFLLLYEQIIRCA